MDASPFPTGRYFAFRPFLLRRVLSSRATSLSRPACGNGSRQYGPYTTVYNRFNRWRKAGIWDRLMDAIVKAHGGKVQMIDSSIVRVHQHASGVKKRVEFVVWGEAEAASPRRSTRASTRRAARSAS
jgi:hypothetical protein